MALDWGRPLSARLRCGIKVRLGLRMDGTWNTSADCSPAKARGGGILPLCAEPDVCRILRRLVGSLGGLWAGKSGGSYCGVCRRFGSSPFCAVLRGTYAAKDVRRAVRRILQERPPMATADARMDQVRRFRGTPSVPVLLGRGEQRWKAQEADAALPAQRGTTRSWSGEQTDDENRGGAGHG